MVVLRRLVCVSKKGDISEETASNFPDFLTDDSSLTSGGDTAFFFLIAVFLRVFALSANLDSLM